MVDRTWEPQDDSWVSMGAKVGGILYWRSLKDVGVLSCLKVCRSVSKLISTSWSWTMMAVVCTSFGFYQGGACDAPLSGQLRFGHSHPGSCCSTYHNLEVLGSYHMCSVKIGCRARSAKIVHSHSIKIGRVRSESSGFADRGLVRLGHIRFEIHDCSVRDFAVEGPGRS